VSITYTEIHELEVSGLITKIFDNNEGFMDAVLAVAKSILKLPADALTANKALMMSGTRDALLETNRREWTEFRRLARGKECRDAVLEFETSQNKKRQQRCSKI
jgi:peroxisomal 3,2-trans-enoyl-CoA isomerase